LVDDALLVDPVDDVLLDLRFDLLTELQRNGEALETANTRVALDPNDARAHAVVAHALLRMPSARREALAAARRAVQLDPESGYGWLQLVRAQLALKRHRDAHRTVDEMLARVPDAQATATAAAIVAIDKTADPSWLVYVLLFFTCLIYPWLLYELYQYLLRRRRLARADRLLRERLAQEPESAVLLSLLGSVADSRGRLKSGLDFSVRSGRQGLTFSTPDSVHQRGRRIVLCVAAVVICLWGILVTLMFTQGIRPGNLTTRFGVTVTLLASLALATIATIVLARAFKDVPPELRRRLRITELRVTGACAVAAAATALLAGDEQLDAYLIPYYLISGFVTAAALLCLVLVGWLRLDRRR